MKKNNKKIDIYKECVYKHCANCNLFNRICPLWESLRLFLFAKHLPETSYDVFYNELWGNCNLFQIRENMREYYEEI